MTFIEHSNLKDKHALLSPSNFHWINYDDEKLIETYRNKQAVEEGTRTHAFAALCIERGQKLPRSNKTLNLYVNDAIGYKLKPEQILYYSDNCFGTADAIGFLNNTLRIHDLKTGKTKADVTQLELYAALFCLEYQVNPIDINIELRIYQYDSCNIFNPDPERIKDLKQIIIHHDKIVNKLRREG